MKRVVWVYLTTFLMALVVAACGGNELAPGGADNRPPSVEIIYPGEGQATASNFVLKAQASSGDRLKHVEYVLDDGKPRSLEPRSTIGIPLQGLADGVHTITLTVVDAQNQAQTITRRFVVDSASQPDVDFSVGFDPTAFGFEINQQGQITVASHTVTFINKVGALAVFIEGYRIEFDDKNGVPLIFGDSQLLSRGSLSVFVPASQEPVSISNFINVPAAVVEALLVLNPVGTHADVYFNGTDVLGKDFEAGPFEVAVVYPVGSD